MSPFYLQGPLVKYAIAASLHGLVDFDEPRRLLPYCLLPLSLPGPLTTLAFGLASIRHFAVDVGAWQSVVGHVALVTCACISPSVASTIFSLYYLTVHVPLTFHIISKHNHKLAVYLAGTTCVTMYVVSHISCDFVTVHHLAQRLVIAHVLASDVM